MIETPSLGPVAPFRRDVSAARITAACDDARRRLERDLHDGAQQRLVALSLRLCALGMRLPQGSEAETLLGGAQEELAAALEELRDLAHGLHPAVLTAHGLPAALEGLAARAMLPVTLEVRVERRLAPPVEVAAYYVVSEALANVDKHARATGARVTVDAEGARLVVEVADDGVGGAAVSAGSGLEGLSDRVGALGGRLEVADGPTGGTVLRVAVPVTRGR